MHITSVSEGLDESLPDCSYLASTRYDGSDFQCHLTAGDQRTKNPLEASGLEWKMP